ncbi:hypothetical protein OSB04_007531 [Centaurea solstitialis]|uniref:Ferredoxin-thioredoxin reductase catalytic chain, chloroplastic n=1 Tax=Centaurea solstitialis TaxID=347529 RepID=A0AA38WTB5_9ASTR|nr:hypothetical protein OSB04_007531 [Centaurea solstitialis]
MANTMTSFPATSSCSVGFAIPSAVTRQTRFHGRRAVIAKGSTDMSLFRFLVSFILLLVKFFCLFISAAEPSDKSVEIMRKFSEQYARKSDTFFCVDKGVTSVVIKGLADHRDSLGAPLCPCRQVHYDDKAAEASQGFWNCPCVPMRERKECHCMLFLTPDNDFAGKDQVIDPC